MDSSLAECEKALREIHHQIQTIELETNLLKSQPQNTSISRLLENLLARIKQYSSHRNDVIILQELRQHLSTSITIKRQFDYRSIIVSIYGALEQFLDSLVAEYIRCVNELVTSKDQLPENISKNHTSLSMELLSRVQQTGYRGSDSVKSIVQCLHSCTSNDPNFKLNATAYANRRANYRTNVISQIFSQAGIPNILDSAKKQRAFQSKVLTLFPESDVTKLDSKTVFHLLDDLAERRNDVAHGNTSDVLSIDLLKQSLALVEATISAIHQVTSNALLPFYKNNNKTVFTGHPIKVHNNSIVCLSIQGCVVRHGDLLIAYAVDESMFCACLIGEMQVNNKITQYIDAESDSIDIGISVSFHAKDNYIYSIVPKEFVL